MKSFDQELLDLMYDLEEKAENLGPKTVCTTTVFIDDTDSPTLQSPLPASLPLELAAGVIGSFMWRYAAAHQMSAADLSAWAPQILKAARARTEEDTAGMTDDLSGDFATDFYKTAVVYASLLKHMESSCRSVIGVLWNSEDEGTLAAGIADQDMTPETWSSLFSALLEPGFTSGQISREDIEEILRGTLLRLLYFQEIKKDLPLS